MLELDHFMNIHLLRKEGHSIRRIARLSGHSRNTVRKVLKERAPRRRKSGPTTANSMSLKLTFDSVTWNTNSRQCD